MNAAYVKYLLFGETRHSCYVKFVSQSYLRHLRP
jgi:hypothetical protein